MIFFIRIKLYIYIYIYIYIMEKLEQCIQILSSSKNMILVYSNKIICII